MRAGWAGIRAGVVIGVLAASRPAIAQVGRDAPQPSPCLRFAFGPWNPPLNWEVAGHPGNADANGQAARRLRDSIFLQQPGSAAADGMVWDEKSGGQRLFVFPVWWPVGIVVQFDSATLARDTLRGIAEAMVADGTAAQSIAKVRALRVACGNSR